MDPKAIKSHAIDHGALIINDKMYKSSFSVMLPLDESLGIQYDHWPET